MGGRLVFIFSTHMTSRSHGGVGPDGGHLDSTEVGRGMRQILMD